MHTLPDSRRQSRIVYGLSQEPRVAARFPGDDTSRHCERQDKPGSDWNDRRRIHAIGSDWHAAGNVWMRRLRSNRTTLSFTAHRLARDPIQPKTDVTADCEYLRWRTSICLRGADHRQQRIASGDYVRYHVNVSAAFGRCCCPNEYAESGGPENRINVAKPHRPRRDGRLCV